LHRLLQIDANKAKALHKSLLLSDPRQLADSLCQIEQDTQNDLEQLAIQTAILSQTHQQFNELQLDKTTLETNRDNLTAHIDDQKTAFEQSQTQKRESSEHCLQAVVSEIALLDADLSRQREAIARLERQLEIQRGREREINVLESEIVQTNATIKTIYDSIELCNSEIVQCLRRQSRVSRGRLSEQESQDVFRKAENERLQNQKAEIERVIANKYSLLDLTPNQGIEQKGCHSRRRRLNPIHDGDELSSPL
jgi:hypothetical protein